MFEEKEFKTVAIDFDGVIHNDTMGFHDGTIYGDIIDGSQDAIKQIAQKYHIVIFTAKAKKERPLINNMTGKELVWEWLQKHDLDQYVDEVTAEKPRAFLYIDDRGYRFKNWKDSLLFLKQFNT